MSKSIQEMWDSVSGKALDQPDDKDYPGKTPPRNRPGGEYAEQRRMAKQGHKTYTFKTPSGETKTFYTISTVASIFGRKPVTIRAWEDRGDLPRPKYRTPKPRGSQFGESKTAGKRLYTQEQVDFLVALCERYNMVDQYTADWAGFRAAMADYPTD